MQDVIILGTGGGSIEAFDLLATLGLTVRGFLDDSPERIGTEIHGAPVLGPLASANRYADCLFLNGIGSPGNFWKKRDILARTGIEPNRWITAIHPFASVSQFSRVGAGTAIFANATVGVHVEIGRHVVLLPSSVVSHDCRIGDYTCICSGACLSGGVTVGESSYIGTGAVVR